jgi:hypothetical protein
MGGKEKRIGEERWRHTRDIREERRKDRGERDKQMRKT